MTSTLDDILSLRASADAPAPEQVEPTPQPDPTPEPTPEPTPAPASEPSPEPKPEDAKPEQPARDNTLVPRAALEEERAKRRKYTDELADVRKQFSDFQNQFQGFMQAFKAQPAPQTQAPAEPPPPKPEIWDDPEGFVRNAVAPIAQTVESQRLQMSEMLEMQKPNGPEAIEAATTAIEQAVKTDPAARADLQRIMKSAHPYGELLGWHKRHQVQAEIGNDPAAYRERLKAELLAELQQQQTATPDEPKPQASTTPAVMPSNLAGARNVASRSGPAWSGPTSLTDIFAR